MSGTKVDTERALALLAPTVVYGITVDEEKANAAFIDWAQDHLPTLLDEVKRLRADDWLPMYLEAIRVFRTTCLDVAKRIAAGGSLADVVGLVGSYMDQGCDGLLDEETVALLVKAKAVALGEAAPEGVS